MNLGGGCGTAKDVSSFSTSAPISTFLVFTTATATSITFDLTSITSVTRNAILGNLSFSGTGTLHFNGLDDTAASFQITAQGSDVSSVAGTVFVTSTPPVPEPATWALMSLGVAALSLRRRARS